MACFTAKVSLLMRKINGMGATSEIMGKTFRALVAVTRQSSGRLFDRPLPVSLNRSYWFEL